jgi:hypothetical protein
MKRYTLRRPAVAAFGYFLIHAAVVVVLIILSDHDLGFFGLMPYALAFPLGWIVFWLPKGISTLEPLVIAGALNAFFVYAVLGGFREPKRTEADRAEQTAAPAEPD